MPYHPYLTWTDAPASGSIVLIYSGVSKADGLSQHQGISRPIVQLADAGGGTYTVTKVAGISNMKADSVTEHTYLIDGDLP